MNGKAKGSGYERDFCRTLSRWWTEGERPRDDCFWRTASSGGRATQRGKKQQETAGHHGDICATGPDGEPFIDLITTELKRGQNNSTIADLLDRSGGMAPQMYEKWLEQAIAAHENAGSFAWMLIVRRDKRIPFVFIPTFLFLELRRVGAFDWEGADPLPYLSLHCVLPERGRLDVTGMTLGAFFQGVGKEHIIKLARIA